MLHLAILPLTSALMLPAEPPCCSQIEAPKAAALGEETDWTGVLDEESFAALHELKEGEAPDLLGEDVEVGGMTCYLTSPENGTPLGAVIVIHEWWGLNDHVKHWCDRLASDGYVALAVDLYGGTVATDRDGAMAAMRAVDEEAAAKKLAAAHAWLRDADGPVNAERTACIGWCFGGGWSLKTAIAEPDLDAAVMYYGRLETDVDVLKDIEAPMLGVFGDQDTGIPPKSVKEFAKAMETAGNDLTIRNYDAAHAFANPSSGRYDAEHAEAAWEETRAFLCKHMFPALSEGAFFDGSRTMSMDIPAGWKEGPEKRMRLNTFEITATTSCVISSFGGELGGLEANVQRWLGQVGQEPMGSDEIEALPRIPVLGVMAPVLQASGPYRGMDGTQVEDGALVVAFCQIEGETVVVKLLGAKAEVEGATPKFMNLCRSLR